MFFLQLFRLYNYVKIQHNLKKKLTKYMKLIRDHTMLITF